MLYQLLNFRIKKCDSIYYHYYNIIITIIFILFIIIIIIERIL